MGGLIEEWKDIQGFEGLYQVSSLGRIRNLVSGKILKPYNHTRGYLLVCLTKDKKRKQFYVHRIVAKAFIKNEEDKKEVNHIDGNKKNNFAGNLEWCTQIENWEHSLKTGLREKCESVKIKVFSKEGKFLYEFPSIVEASRKMRINVGNISRCCNGNCKSAGGYIFRKVV